MLVGVERTWILDKSCASKNQVWTWILLKISKMLKHCQGAQYSNGQPWPDPTAKEEGLFDKQQPGGFLHLFAIFRILSLPIFQIDSQDEIFSPLPSSSKGRAASLSRATFPPPRISELSRFTNPIIVARMNTDHWSCQRRDWWSNRWRHAWKWNMMKIVATNLLSQFLTRGQSAHPPWPWPKFR